MQLATLLYTRIHGWTLLPLCHGCPQFEDVIHLLSYHTLTPLISKRGPPESGEQHLCRSTMRYLSHLLLLLPSGVRRRRFTNHLSWKPSLRSPGINHYAHLRFIMRHNLDSITLLIASPLSGTPLGSFPRQYCFMSRCYSYVVLFHVLCYIKLTSCTCFSTPTYTLGVEKHVEHLI